MRRLTILSLVAALLGVFANPAAPAQPAGIPDEIIKELDRLVGTWEAKGTIGDKEQTGEFACRWARGQDNEKCCLFGRFSYTTAGETRSGVTLIGWNATKKCIDDRGFDSSGGCATLSWTIKSPTESIGEIVMVGPDGKEVTSKASLVKKGPSQLVLESQSSTGERLRIVYTKTTEKSGEKRKR